MGNLADLRAMVYGEVKAKIGRSCSNSSGRILPICRGYNLRMGEIGLEDPLALFDLWMKDAQLREPNDPSAAALATCTADGQPSVRMVLIKQVGQHRFAFFTNAGSRKGRELAENPRVALCFHWKSLRRQVRVEGPVTELPGSDVDAYFHSRSRESQIGAAVSLQSQVLVSRDELEARVRTFAEAHLDDEIPRPDHWRGFYVEPARIEFWIDGAHRLHDRFLFSKEGSGWQTARLYP
jgi:pyridoxamine 5'-phosphate oxidase